MTAEAAIAALSTAFRSRDVDAAMACFADVSAIAYTGSEPDEAACGQNEVKQLFTELFQRPVAYSWEATSTWTSSHGSIHLVVAELTAHEHDDGDVTDFPYRLSGALRYDDDIARWLLVHGSEPTGTDPPGPPP